MISGNHEVKEMKKMKSINDHITRVDQANKLLIGFVVHNGIFVIIFVQIE